MEKRLIEAGFTQAQAALLAKDANFFQSHESKTVDYFIQKTKAIHEALQRIFGQISLDETREVICQRPKLFKEVGMKIQSDDARPNQSRLMQPFAFQPQTDGLSSVFPSEFELFLRQLREKRRRRN